MKAKNHLGIIIFNVMILLLIIACSQKQISPAPVTEAAVEAHGYSGPAWPPVALLKPGENPLWFEAGSGGPQLIESPTAASLTAFFPWPFARFIVDMQVWDDFLAMPVNGDGFLVLGSAADDSSAVLYRINSGGIWNSYTAESFFVWDDRPAILLYRNDFFIEPEAPSLRPQVYALDKSSPVPLAVSVPALESFLSEGPWEAEVLHRGSGGLWYFRVKEKGKAQATTAYFRTADLAGAGTRISVGEWRNSSNQKISEDISPCLSAIINAASGSRPGGLSLVKLISFEIKEPRFLSPDSAADAGGELLYAYAREADQLALAIFPDGRGFYSSEREPDAQAFALPPLPETFVYTGVAVFEKILVASWEEQQGAGIGAAGFMVLRSPFKL